MYLISKKCDISVLNHKYAKLHRLMQYLFVPQPDESGVVGVTREHDSVLTTVHVLPGETGDTGPRQ